MLYSWRNLSWLISGLGWLALGVTTVISLTLVAILQAIFDTHSVAQRLRKAFLERAPRVGFADVISYRSDFHVDVQDPVNNRVDGARNLSIFLGFNLFAPIPWPFLFQKRMKINTSHLLQQASPFVRAALRINFGTTAIRWNTPR